MRMLYTKIIKNKLKTPKKNRGKYLFIQMYNNNFYPFVEIPNYCTYFYQIPNQTMECMQMPSYFPDPVCLPSGLPEGA